MVALLATEVLSLFRRLGTGTLERDQWATDSSGQREMSGTQFRNPWVSMLMLRLLTNK